MDEPAHEQDISTDEARQGRRAGVVIWILGIGTLVAIVGMFALMALQGSPA